MKKIFVLLFLVIFVFSGCGKENKLFDLDEKHYYTTDALKFVTEKENYSTKDTIITYSITNISKQEHSIAADDNCIELHKLQDGKWKTVGVKTDQNWNALARILYPGEVEKRNLNLEDYFYLPLEKGTYRLSVEYLLSEPFVIS